jgi:rhomboid family GlyGly-CTERM serine protease
MPALIDSYRLSSCQGKWAVCLSIALIAAGLMLFPAEWLRYERQAAFSESWRWLTAHLVHLGPLHLVFNLVGLALVCELFWQSLPVRHGVAVMLLAAGIIDLLLWRFHPELQWYAGLSGIVHALWAACVTATLSQGQARDEEKHRLVALLGAALLLLKIIAERMDVLIPAAAAGGFPVVEAAHGYGALTGVAYVLLWHQSQSLTGRK